MKFSIVIPLYNGANFIEATLDTVIAQTYKNYEIILVNDESPDNVGEVVKKYMSLHPEAKFIYLEQKNLGLGGARNTAIGHASGDIIAILDQDDVWYFNKLERIARIYKDNPEADIVCHSQKIRKNGKAAGIFRPVSYKKDMYRELLFANNRLSASAVTFKKAIIDNIGGLSEDRDNFHFVEDYDLWLRMAEEGYKFYFTDEILGEYNKHDSNFSTNLEVMLRNELNVLEKHFRHFKRKNFWDFYLIQRRKTLTYVRVSKKYFQSRHILAAFRCLIKACLNDPFFITYYFEKLWHSLNKSKGVDR